MKHVFLLALLLAKPAFASGPKELPALWYDLIVAETLAEAVETSCSQFAVDQLVSDRLRNIAIGELAKLGIHNRTPRKPLSISGLALASLRVGSGIPLTDDLCEFADRHLDQQTRFGSRLKRLAD